MTSSVNNLNDSQVSAQNTPTDGGGDALLFAMTELLAAINCSVETAFVVAKQQQCTVAAQEEDRRLISGCKAPILQASKTNKYTSGRWVSSINVAHTKGGQPIDGQPIGHAQFSTPYGSDHYSITFRGTYQKYMSTPHNPYYHTTSIYDYYRVDHHDAHIAPDSFIVQNFRLQDGQVQKARDALNGKMILLNQQNQAQTQTASADSSTCNQNFSLYNNLLQLLVSVSQDINGIGA